MHCGALGRLLDITYDTAKRTISYSQAVIIHVPANCILGSNVEQYMVVLVEMTDAAVSDDLGVQTPYSLLYYRKNTDGTCMVFKVDNTDFFANATITGMAYSGYQGYSGTDIRSASETPTTEIAADIKSSCVAQIAASGTTSPEYNALWYKDGVFGCAGYVGGHGSVAEMIAAMPWTPKLE